MSERCWTTMTAGGLCHLVVVETGGGEAVSPEACAAELKALLGLAAHAGEWAIDVPAESGGQILVAFTSFADAERFAAALRDVRPVRQLDPRWSSQWHGACDPAAIRRLQQDLRWTRRVAQTASSPPDPR